jgi:hypothetical protein
VATNSANKLCRDNKMNIVELVNRYSKAKTSYENCKFWLVAALKQHPQLSNVEFYLDKLEFRKEGIYYKSKRYTSPNEDGEDYELFFRYEDFPEIKE